MLGIAVLTVIAAAFFVVPSASHAGTLDYDGTRFAYTAAAGELNGVNLGAAALGNVRDTAPIELTASADAVCDETGDPAISGTAFGRSLAERGFEGTRTKHGRYRTGLRLREPGEEPGDASTPVTLGDADSGISACARALESYTESPVTIRHPSPDASPEPVPEWVGE